MKRLNPRNGWKIAAWTAALVGSVFSGAWLSFFLRTPASQVAPVKGSGQVIESSDVPSDSAPANAGAGGAVTLTEVDLRRMIRDNPMAAMATLFHEVEAGESLRLLPAAMEELALKDDSEVTAALAQVRTQVELKQAWSLVVAARLKGSLAHAVSLAKEAPPMAELASHFAGDAVKAYGVSAVAPMLAEGLPFSWIAGGLKKTDLSDAMPVFTALDEAVGGKWSSKQASEFLCNLPETAADAKSVIERIFSSNGLNLATKRVAVNLMKENPEHLAIFLSLLPEGYLKQSLASEAASVSDDKEALTRAHLVPETASTIAAPVERAAMYKVLRSGDGGQDALKWALAIPDPIQQETALRAVLSESGSYRGVLQPLKLAVSVADAEQRDSVMDVAVAHVLSQLKERELASDEVDELRRMAGDTNGALRAALTRAEATEILEKLK